MSMIHTIIELSHPDTGVPVERLWSLGRQCGYCKGVGHFWSESDGDVELESCPVCKGSGRMDAEVTVRWTASREGEKLKTNSEKIKVKNEDE